MNRFFLLSALATLLVAGCGKGSDSNATARKDDTTKPADSARSEAKPADPRVEPASAGDLQGDVTGSYMAIEALPAPFSEIQVLLLANIDENAKPAPLNGFIRPKDMKAKDYTLVDPKLDGKKLTFSTVEVDGVSYRFDGEFRKLDSFAFNPPPVDEPVLGGKLSRVKSGKVEAETPVTFAYVLGD